MSMVLPAGETGPIWMGPLIIHPATGFFSFHLLVAGWSSWKFGWFGLLQSPSEGLLGAYTPTNGTLLCPFNRCFRRFMIFLSLFLLLCSQNSLSTSPRHLHLDKQKGNATVITPNRAAPTERQWQKWFSNSIRLESNLVYIMAPILKLINCLSIMIFAPACVILQCFSTSVLL